MYCAFLFEFMTHPKKCIVLVYLNLYLFVIFLMGYMSVPVHLNPRPFEHYIVHVYLNLKPIYVWSWNYDLSMYVSRIFSHCVKNYVVPLCRNFDRPMPFRWALQPSFFYFTPVFFLSWRWVECPLEICGFTKIYTH